MSNLANYSIILLITSLIISFITFLVFIIFIVFALVAFNKYKNLILRIPCLEISSYISTNSTFIL